MIFTDFTAVDMVGVAAWLSESATVWAKAPPPFVRLLVNPDFVSYKYATRCAF